MRKVVGVGINDVELSGPACTARDSSGKKYNYPDYAMWYGMLVRCYSKKWKDKIPSIRESTCCEEWLLRSNFQIWYNSQEVYRDNSGKVLGLDKDMLIHGNKVYSPETCCLVPDYINTLMNFRPSPDSSLPMWVAEVKDRELKKRFKSIVSVDGIKSKCLGYLLTPELAHSNSQKYKYLAIISTLEKYKQEECFRTDVYNSILNRAETIRKDRDSNKLTSTF